MRPRARNGSVARSPRPSTSRRERRLPGGGGIAGSRRRPVVASPAATGAAGRPRWPASRGAAAASRSSSVPRESSATKRSCRSSAVPHRHRQRHDRRRRAPTPARSTATCGSQARDRRVPRAARCEPSRRAMLIGPTSTTKIIAELDGRRAAPGAGRGSTPRRRPPSRRQTDTSSTATAMAGSAPADRVARAAQPVAEVQAGAVVARSSTRPAARPAGAPTAMADGPGADRRCRSRHAGTPADAP